MGNHTQVSAVSSEGDQIHVNQTTTDSPILPAENIRALAEIDPRFVDFVLTQTEKEADFRRGETIRTNGFVFKERMTGILSGAAVAIFGLGASAVVIYSGHDWAGALLGGATLVTIVTVLVRGKSNQTQEKPKADLPKRQKSRRP